ncbi:phosphoribosyltransferase [Candidatus Bathyarchaeota archaeon]|nr:phosphoribosyltransferase [Candidatus Bathyarchaeota archaeon]MBT4320307.1 phosphoribosyltransferase [Candidatus Bathyarchaeota archaeon]MBT4423568.1 phosphoribosyltransferase [Candidatus Bathyarchaeota archaeon]MBT5643201.1 phosphoribosyltransferase [Candidatus Bathyarchaeota archaeon]MBT6605083.1 phosphoribosyltransferase [Candidatus Bathyarchaeota archaeon]
MADLEFLFLSWDDVQGLSEKVSDLVLDSGYKPDLMIAISRGGFDPARIMSDQLNIRKLASLQIIYYTGLNTKRDKPEVLFPLNAQVEGLRVLVVDDVSDSGNSLIAVKKYVEDRGAVEVRLATLHHKPWSKFKPDYYAEEVSKWIIYPWEPRESVIELVHMLTDAGIEKDMIPAKLKKIGFSDHQIDRYLKI